MRLIKTTAILLISCTPFAANSQPAESEVSAIDTVRSLQRIFGSAALGDRSAFEMQRIALKLADQRLVKLSDEDLKDSDNRRAVFLYAISGGNPSTISELIAKIEALADPDELLIVNALRSLILERKSIPDDAIASLPISLSESAPYWLFNGMYDSTADISLSSFQRAAVLSPGTLVEEAALRRSIPILSEARNIDRLMLVASRYLRTFVKSPYASEFVVQFSGAATIISEEGEMEKLVSVLDFLDKTRRESLVSKIIKNAVLVGNLRLARYLNDASNSSAVPEEPNETEDIYAIIADLAGQRRDQAIAKVRSLPAVAGNEERQALINAAKRAADLLSDPWSKPLSIEEEKNDMVAEPTEDTKMPAQQSDISVKIEDLEKRINKTQDYLAEISK